MYVITSRTSFRVNLHSLNAKDLPARSTRYIWSLSDSNGIRNHNHLVREPTLSHLAKLVSLAKWLSVGLQIKWLRVRIPLLSLSYYTTLNPKINEIKIEIPSINNLAKTAALTNVANKKSNVSDLVRKTN